MAIHIYKSNTIPLSFELSVYVPVLSPTLLLPSNLKIEIVVNGFL